MKENTPKAEDEDHEAQAATDERDFGEQHDRQQGDPAGRSALTASLGRNQYLASFGVRVSHRSESA